LEQLDITYAAVYFVEKIPQNLHDKTNACRLSISQENERINISNQTFFQLQSRASPVAFYSALKKRQEGTAQLHYKGKNI
jgi:hypothetical protein